MFILHHVKQIRNPDRIDYRLKENQNPDKRCVMVAREHYSPEEKASNALHCGAKRSHVFVAHTESQSVIKVLLTNSLNLIRKSIRMKVRLMMSCCLTMI